MISNNNNNLNDTNPVSSINPTVFDPRIIDGEKTSQVIWTTETMHLARKGLEQGFQLSVNPFLKTIKDVLLKKANIPFQMSEDEKWAFERCMFDKVFFGNNFTSLKDAQHGWRRIKLRDYQEKLLDNYSKNRWNIVLFPRQSGKTTTTIIDIVHFLTFNTDKDCVVIAQSERVVNEILSKIKEVFASLPYFLQTGFLNFTKNGCRLDNGCRLVVGVASESVVQGFSLDYVFLDEFAYIPPSRVQKFWNNIYPTLANNPESKCIITSTPNGRNLFWELWNNSVNNRNLFVPSRIYWTDVPNRDEKFKQDTIKNVGIEGWEMGFECSFDTQLKSIFNAKTQKILRELQKEAEPKQHLIGSITNSPNPDKKIDNQTNSDIIYWSEDNHFIGSIFNIEFIHQNIIPFNLKEDYFLIGIDIAEGLKQDFTTIKIRKLFWDKSNKTLIFKTIGVYKDNTISVEDFAELTLKLFKHFNYNKIRVCVDLTNYGNEYFAHIKKLKLYDIRFYSHDDIIFAKFESNTKKDYELGCRWNKQNKKMGVRSLTGLVNKQEFYDNHYASIDEYLNFGKNLNDSYSAQYGNDDLIMADVLMAHFVKSNNLYANEFLKEAEYWLRVNCSDLTDEMILDQEYFNRQNSNNIPEINGYFLRDHNLGYKLNNHQTKSKKANMLGSLSIDKNYGNFENINYLSNKKHRKY